MTSVRDIIIIAVILFSVGLLISFVVNVSHRVNVNLLSIPVMNQSTEAVQVINSSDAAQSMMDYIYLALFIGFFLSIVIFGYVVGGDVLFAVIYFFIVIIFTFVSVLLQLTWNEIVTNSTLQTTMALLPITNYIVGHLGMFMAIFGIAGILAMFTKPPTGNNIY